MITHIIFFCYLLRKVLKPRLISVFVDVVAGGIETAPDILDETLKNKINAASFEATAITAAISFEQKAVKMYAQRAEQADNPEEKKMYTWLSTWEKTHLKKLEALEKSLIEDVWNDNRFWPF